MKKSGLSIDVEIYLSDQEYFGRGTEGKKPEFCNDFRHFVFEIIMLFLS